jgi:cold shock CspA family protein
MANPLMKYWEAPDGTVYEVCDEEARQMAASGGGGVSPTVAVSAITGGHRITITDVNGSKSFNVMDGEDGDDGYSPTIKVSTITGGHRVTITDVNGTKYFDVKDGENGTGGGTGGGENGVTFYPFVDSDGTLSWTNDGDLTNPDPVNLKGGDGYSPTVSVTSITGGKRISITDKNGTKTADILNGSDGDDGVGISSVQQTTTSSADGGTNVITVTLSNGQKATFDVKNGRKGGDGVSIVSVEQTTTSSEDGGSNVITVNLSNGQKSTFTVKNGSKGSSGRGVSSMVYNSSTNKWTVTYTDNTTATVDGPVIPDVSDLMPKSGGTFTGRVIASTQTASVSLLRNSKLVAADTDPAVNGEINWTYA